MYLFAATALKKQVLNKGSPQAFRFVSLGLLMEPEGNGTSLGNSQQLCCRHYFHERQMNKEPESSKCSQKTKKTDRPATCCNQELRSTSAEQQPDTHIWWLFNKRDIAKPFTQYLELFHLYRKMCISTHSLVVWERHFWSLLALWISLNNIYF